MYFTVEIAVFSPYCRSNREMYKGLNKTLCHIYNKNEKKYFPDLLFNSHNVSRRMDLYPFDCFKLTIYPPIWWQYVNVTKNFVELRPDMKRRHEAKCFY